MQRISKSIAAAVAGLIISFLAANGIVLESDVAQAVEVIVVAVVAAVVVYLAPANK